MSMRVICALLGACLTLHAEDSPKDSKQEKRPLALIALIDNHNSDPVKGALADFIGRETTGIANLRGAYQRLRWLTGQNATYANFFREIRKAADDGYVIDVFIEGHGSPHVLVCQGGKNIRSEDVRRELYLRGGERIRLVYMMACYGSTLNSDWLAVGAKAVTGHKEVNAIPVFHLPVFLTRWVGGSDARSATAAGYKFGESMGKSQLYKSLTKWFQGEDLTDKQVEEESRVVYQGRNVTINDLPTRAEEDEWVSQAILADLRPSADK